MTDRPRRLAVWLHGRIAGVLDAPEDDERGPVFAYEPDYVRDAPSLPLSVSLSVRAEPYRGAVVRNWFSNLLPEGEMRLAVAERLKLSDRDDFGLLAAIGRECAGAVSIVPEGESVAADGSGDATPISPAQLYAWLKDRPSFLLAENVPARLSLAGAQNKLAVVLTQRGGLALPAPGAPSTFLLKAPNPRFAGLVTLEAFAMRLAVRAGLPVAPVQVLPADPACLLIERFDRNTPSDAPPRIARVHQEDFCQALGIPPELKYEAQGGPSFAQCAALIRRVGAGGAALRDFVRWAAFNVVAGNADAHGKNIALLHHADGTTRLAPFYDLIPTVFFRASMLSRELAMRIGPVRDIDRVDATGWRDFARECGLGPAFVLREVERTRTAILESIDSTVAQLIEESCDAEVLGRAAEILRSRAATR